MKHTLITPSQWLPSHRALVTRWLAYRAARVVAAISLVAVMVSSAESNLVYQSGSESPLLVKPAYASDALATVARQDDPWPPSEAQIEDAKNRFVASVAQESEVVEVVLIKNHRPDQYDPGRFTPGRWLGVELYVLHRYRAPDPRSARGILLRDASLIADRDGTFNFIHYGSDRAKSDLDRYNVAVLDYIIDELKRYGKVPCWPGERCDIQTGTTPPTEAPGVSVAAIPGYDIPWNVSERVAVRLEIASTEPSWYINRVCDINESANAGFYEPQAPGTCVDARVAPSVVVDSLQARAVPARNIEAPVSIPMSVSVELVSAVTGKTENISQPFSVDLKGAYRLRVQNSGVTITGSPETVGLGVSSRLSGAGISVSAVGPDGATTDRFLSTGESSLGFWGELLSLPAQAEVYIRFWDGSAGLISASQVDESYEELYMAMSADEMSFQAVGGASIASIVTELGENAVEDRVFDLLFRRLSGPAGMLHDLTLPVGGKAYRILLR
jgi:hypothetical protein